MHLFNKILGTGKPIIILHGLFGSSDNWLTFGRMLEKHGFKIFLVDLQNHGQSPHTNSFTYEEMANDIKNFLKENKLSDVILIGHSMGGKAAMKFAFENSNTVAKLIVIDIAPRYYTIHHDQILDSLNSLDLKKVNSRSDADALLNNQINDLSVRQFLLKNLYWTEQHKLAWRFNLSVITEQIENVGEAVIPEVPFNKPALFIKGAKSDYITYDDEREIFNLFSNVQVETVPDAGHWVHAENPNKLLEIMLNFIN